MEEENIALDWYQNGPPCMNCGKRVTSDLDVWLEEDTIVFKGMCKSKQCQQLPPGGNPFVYMINSGEEE